MAGVVSTDHWSVREKLCLASSVIRSGDQNWVSVSRAIKPFGEPGRPPDWFSQKNCACQYSALLETVETPKRKRSERGEIVDTPGDLIVRKMTKERIVELKAQLEEDKVRYRRLQQEIEKIRSGQADDKLQSMWDEIQEEKRAAKEADDAQRAAAETAAKAAAAVKLASKPGFQSPIKRRPQVKHARLGSRTQSETSSVGDVEVEDNPLASPVKVTGEQGSSTDVSNSKIENSAAAVLTSIEALESQEVQDATTNQEEQVAADADNEEMAERLLAATASDLVELLSPYPEDSSSSQSIDESSMPTSDSTTQAPRVKEPLILKIEKGVVKTREPKVETKVPKSEECPEPEMINVDGPVSDQPPTEPQADKNLDTALATKPSVDPGDDDYHHIEPPSPEDSASRDDADIKQKRKGVRGRPSGSQRKSSRIRTHAAAEEEDDHSQLDIPSGRRSAGKDGTASGITSLIDDDSKDTHSDGGDSDVTDKPSESDDLSTSAGALQSSYFMDSLPNSPASIAHSEEDHAYKIWRKAIMLVWRAIASHKYANVFLHPVTEDIAPGYKSIVLRPIDLITIKKNIENGLIRTTEQFHRDMMLMFQNAIMYNNADQHVHQIATIMQADVVKQIEEFVSTQLLVQQPDSTKMLRGRGKQGQVEEDRSRRSSTDTETSGKKRRTRADEC